MQIIFLDPSRQTEPRVINELKEIILHTHGVLRIAVAYFTHPVLAQTLIKRIEDGKTTLLLVNSSDLLRPTSPQETEIVVSKDLLSVLNLSHCGIGPLYAKSLGTRTQTQYQNMHHKFVVSNEKVIFGSLNWTKSALQHNYEFISISTDSNVIEKFMAEFTKMWEQAFDVLTNKTGIRIIACPICNEQWGIDFESYGPFCVYCGHKFKVV